MSTLPAENPSIPFYILKLIVRTGKITRKQDTRTTWFGLTAGCYYLLHSTWKTSKGEERGWWKECLFSGSLLASWGWCGQVPELLEALMDQVAPMGGSWLGNDTELALQAAFHPFPLWNRQRGRLSSCTFGVWDSEWISSTANTLF